MISLLALALVDPVSFTRDIEPIFAFHCNHCHAAPPATTAAQLNTSTYAGLMAGGGMGRAITPGDPARSLLMEFLDGRRAKRMPLNEPPLSPVQTGLISRWIAEGARVDHQPKLQLTRPLKLSPGRPFTVLCRVTTRAYLKLTITGPSGEQLHHDETAIPQPAGGEARWPLTAGPNWPKRATVLVEISPHAKAELSVIP